MKEPHKRTQPSATAGKERKDNRSVRKDIRVSDQAIISDTKKWARQQQRRGPKEGDS